MLLQNQNSLAIDVGALQEIGLHNANCQSIT
jgi:hypothetical protein